MESSRNTRVNVLLTGGFNRGGMFRGRKFYLQTIFFILLSFHLAPLSVEARLIGKPAPEINNSVWINSSALEMADLRGNVVLLQFWTYG